jgi:hypothetical protein
VIGASIDRRALLGSMARWAVPTVVSITVGARTLQARSSCPPCRIRQPPVTGTCRPCTVNQMLSCNCEPCLGAPYCASPSLVAPGPQSQSLQVPAPGGRSMDPGPYGSSLRVDARRDALLRLQAERRRAAARTELFPDPFGVERVNPATRPATPGLYERLQQTPSRRSN